MGAVDDGAGSTVRSTDGTPIAVWRAGTGPPILLVHGSLSDHATFDPLIAELHDMACFAMDRRGFGSSGDGGDYSIEREFEDVAAVVDAIATRAEDLVTVLGHSYGAGCAMGGAGLTGNVRTLLLYEPGLGLAYQPGTIDAIEEKLATGRADDAIEMVLVDIVGVSPDELASFRSSPRWPVFVAGVPLVVREARVEHGWVYEPGMFDGITAPALFLAGSESPEPLREATERAAAAIGAPIRVLDGHGHLATRTDPALVAGIIRDRLSA
jgi:pimeloyl-ACP methyl ester carboxylesterase